MTDTSGWHLRREVSWTLIITVALQLIGFGALWARLENRVTHLEQQQAIYTLVPERLTRVEVILERIEKQLSR